MTESEPQAEKTNVFNRKIYLKGQDCIEVTISEKGGTERITHVNGQTKAEISSLSGHSNLKEYAYADLRDRYKNFFSQTFENLVFLTGAGSSKNIGKSNKGLLTSEFWDIIEDFLNQKYSDDKLFESLCSELDYDKQNIETLLSKAFLLTGLKGDPSVKTGNGTYKITDLVSSIETKIKELCTIELPENSPHKELLRKVGNRKASLPRIKIFTLNYDLLFEQASTQINAILIDGFSYSYPREFSGRNFDYDIVKRNNTKLKKEEHFLERVFHLYKPHGSINWKQLENPTKVVIEENPDRALMIYPRSNKYEASYDQPFFEMMSRFQEVLRKENTTLVTIGFSFSDKHIVTAIIEALNQNPSFNLVIIDPFFDNHSNKTLQDLLNFSSQTDRVLFIAEYFEKFAEHYPENKSYPEEDFQTFGLSSNNIGNSKKPIESASGKESIKEVDNDEETPF